MSENMIFCLGESEIVFQKKYHVFNKPVNETRYNEIKCQVYGILKDLRLELNKNSWADEWKKVTKGQWIKLSQIPEFDIDVVEGIIGFMPDIESDKIRVIADGKIVEISRESAIALNLIS